MNTSICITVLNEEKTISKLLDSLLNQSKKASEIVIVDGGSTDRTVEIIRHYQKKHSFIKLMVEKSSRAKARNMAVDIAGNEIIAMTDAGCIADKNWLKNITHPFTYTHGVHVVAGFYRMTGSNPVSKAMSVFMGITSGKFNYDFLPSTRSIAFTKKIWEEVGGFPEKTSGTAEDTMFNYKLIKSGVRISRVKDALVEWGMPETIADFRLKLMNYAKGDIESGKWIFPGKGIMSHNIKVLLVFARYLVFLLLFLSGFVLHWLFAYLLALISIYLFWSFRKVYMEFDDWKTAVWGPVLQINSDFAVMKGFILGFLG